MTQLDEAILRNRKRFARHRAAFARFKRIATRIFEYEDMGKRDKAERVMALCRKRMKENPVR